MKTCLIGRTLKHSYSKIIHESFGYEYDLVETELEGLENLLKHSDYDCFNVTIPYKTEVIKYLDYLSETARDVGAVNTIVKREGKLYGYNTDVFGMRYMMNYGGFKLKNKSVMILGSGGTSKTAEYVCNLLGAKNVVVVSRNGKVNYSNASLIKPDYVINTTPVGMFPNQFETPINLQDYKSVKGVIDVIYNPENTALTFSAKQMGLKAVNGLSMLVAQAKYSKDIFLGKELTEDFKSPEILRAIKKLSLTLGNIVLIGMPGSGKSAVGKYLSKITNKEFIDTDELTLEKTGKTPEEIIVNSGESAFRKIESEILKELSLKRGIIVSTGGGAVTVPENEFYIKCASLVVCVKRKLKLLSTENRPLTSTYKKIKSVYKKRKKLYKKFSHVTINNEDIEETSKRILKLCEF